MKYQALGPTYSLWVVGSDGVGNGGVGGGRGGVVYGCL